MRYIIIGAGAIGGTIGARLFESGHEVVLTARGAHYGALRDGGLRFATPDQTVTLPVPAVSGPGELTLRPDDVLILSVKTQDSAAALDAWAGQPVGGGEMAAQALPVFCAQNGVASERIALRRFRRVYGVTVWLPATHLEPGAVEAEGTPMSGLLPVGPVPVRDRRHRPPGRRRPGRQPVPQPGQRGRDAAQVRQAAVQPGQRGAGGVRH